MRGRKNYEGYLVLGQRNWVDSGIGHRDEMIREEQVLLRARMKNQKCFLSKFGVSIGKRCGAVEWVVAYTYVSTHGKG